MTFINFFKTPFFLLFISFVVLLSCRKEKKEVPKFEKPLTEEFEEPEKSYHEKYLEEIAFISTRKDSASTKGMLKIEGGKFTMGGNNKQARQDEFPQHEESVETIWVDETEVTNAQFREFVDETGYITTAERSFKIEGDTYPPGAMVFNAENPDSWWKFVKGANWKHPYGPESSIEGKDNYPVTQVSWYDAMAYAKWAGKRLPTETEYEYLLRGGKNNEIYPWGNDFEKAPQQTNFHQGEFPVRNTTEDEFEKSAPVKSFPPNDFGLYDMAGNVWEWCLDTYYPNAYNITNRKEEGYFKDYYNQKQHKVIRGGSFLCSESYCTGYRNAARMSSSPDSSLEHTGFRCVKDI